MKGFLNRLIRAGLIVLSVILLGSCDLGAGSGDGGYLGDTFDVSGPLRFRGKDTFDTPDIDGFLEFACASTTFSETAVVDGGAYTVSFGIPDPTDTEPWANLLPPVTPALSISDATAEGLVLNDVLFDRTDPPDDDILVVCSNYDIDVVVWYVYTDKDVTITGSGSYAGPLGTDTIDIDVSLKAGWNRIIMTIPGSGSTAVYRLGSMPSGVYWTYGVS